GHGAVFVARDVEVPEALERLAVEHAAGLEHTGKRRDLRSLHVEDVVVDFLSEGVVRLTALYVAVIDAGVRVPRVCLGGEEIDAVDAVAPELVVTGVVANLRAGGQAPGELPSSTVILRVEEVRAGLDGADEVVEGAIFGAESPDVVVGDRVLLGVGLAAVL